MTVQHTIIKLIKPASGNMLDDLPTYAENQIINFICEMPYQTLQKM